MSKKGSNPPPPTREIPYREVDLGAQARDKVSGLVGIVIGKTQFLYGCVRVGIQPKIDSEGKVPEAHWLDEPQVEVIGEGVHFENKGDTGGPVPSIPRKRPNPTRW